MYKLFAIMCFTINGATECTPYNDSSATIYRTLAECEKDAEYRFYGPTCDSIDAIARPYMLPAAMRAGDYIEIGQLGAYGDTMRTNFNGFGDRDEIIVSEEPLLSLFADSLSDSQPNAAEAALPCSNRD